MESSLRPLPPDSPSPGPDCQDQQGRIASRPDRDPSLSYRRLGCCMSAEDNAPASEQADIGEALVAALGFEPTEGLKNGSDGDGDGGPENGSAASSGTSTNRRSKKSRRKNRRGPATKAAAGSASNGSTGAAAAAAGAAAVGGAAGSVDDQVSEGVKSALDEIKSAAKPAVSDRSTIVVGGDEDLEDSWVSVDGPNGAGSPEDGSNSQSAGGSSEKSDPDASSTATDTQQARSGETTADGSSGDGSSAADDRPGEATPSNDTTPDAQDPDDTVLVGGPPAGGAQPAKLADPETVTPPADSAEPSGNGADDTVKVDLGVEQASAGAPAKAAVTAVASIAPAEVKPGMTAPSAPPVVEAKVDDPQLDPAFDPARTGEIRRIETRDDEIQSARIEAETKAKADGREVFERGSLINLFRRSRRLQSRKVRRVVRHVDPWSVLTFSVLFHLCVFAALLLASVLVWNAAEAAGTIEDLEGFILELGDYETFEIKGDVVFRAAVAIAGVLTLASSVLLVLLTVVFNLISDLVGGIRMTVIEEETVRVRRKPGDPTGASSGG